MIKRTAFGLSLLALVTLAAAPVHATEFSCLELGGTSPDFVPVRGQVDFCCAFDEIGVYLEILAEIPGLEVIGDYAYLLNCLTTDINGPLVLDGEVEIPVSGNGMLDAEFELNLIAHVINDTAFDVNGTTSDAAWAAFEANYTFLNGTINTALEAAGYSGLINLAAPTVPDTLAYLLAGYGVVGDDNSIGALETLFGLLADLGVTPPDTSELSTLPLSFAPDADLDGDGVSNRGEYNAYSEDGTDPEAYIAAAIDPNTFPETVMVEDGFRLYGPWAVEAGDTVVLSPPTNMMWTGTASFSWSKDAGPEIGTAFSLTLEDVDEVADAGAYTLVLTDGSKGVYTSAPYNLVVLPAGSMPVSSMVGMGVIALATALAGVAGIRRKK